MQPDGPIDASEDSRCKSWRLIRNRPTSRAGHSLSRIQRQPRHSPSLRARGGRHWCESRLHRTSACYMNVFAVRAHETKLGSSRREDFWFIVAARSEDETEIRAGQSSGRTSSEEHSASDTPAVLG